MSNVGAVDMFQKCALSSCKLYNVDEPCNSQLNDWSCRIFHISASRHNCLKNALFCAHDPQRAQAEALVRTLLGQIGELYDTL